MADDNLFTEKFVGLQGMFKHRLFIELSVLPLLDNKPDVHLVEMLLI